MVMKFPPATKILYTVFSLLGMLLIIIGIIMQVFNFESSYTHGPTYESTRVTGTEVIWLGIGILVAILIFYLIKEKRKPGFK